MRVEKFLPLALPSLRVFKPLPNTNCNKEEASNIVWLGRYIFKLIPTILSDIYSKSGLISDLSTSILPVHTSNSFGHDKLLMLFTHVFIPSDTLLLILNSLLNPSTLVKILHYHHQIIPSPNSKLHFSLSTLIQFVTFTLLSFLNLTSSPQTQLWTSLSHTLTTFY